MFLQEITCSSFDYEEIRNIYGWWHWIEGSDCLLKTQDSAKSKDDV